MTMRSAAMAVVLAAAAVSAAHGQSGMWTPYDGSSGLSCRDFNQAANLRWKSAGGDYAATPSVSVQKLPVVGQWFTMDVTSLLGADAIAIKGDRIWNAHSKESATVASRPRLVVTRADGSEQTLAPVADVRINCSTTQATGTATILKIGEGSEPAMLFFPRVADAVAGRLELMPSTVYSGTAKPTFTAHAVSIPRPAPAAPEPGLAARYPDDDGIAADPDVLFHTGYEPGQYRFGKCKPSNPPVAGYVSTKGLSSENYLGTQGTWQACYPGDREMFPSEQREVFLRMEIRFGADFRDTSAANNGGKLPVGFTAQYDGPGGQEYCGNAGTGCSSGDRGWSARGGYDLIVDRLNPAYPAVTGNQYVYHYQQAGDYGTHLPWGPLAVFELNRWYTVEAQLRVNDPGVANGVLRIWIDGRRSVEYTTLQFRGPTTLQAILDGGGQQLVRGFWLAFFHGGKYPPDNGTGMHAWVDNVVGARKYIGPRVQPSTTPPPAVTPPPTTTPPPVSTPPPATPPIATPPPVTPPPTTTPPPVTPPSTPVNPPAPPLVELPPASPPPYGAAMPRALPAGSGGMHFNGTVSYSYWNVPQPHFKIRAAVVYDCAPLNAKAMASGTYRLSLWASDTTITVPGGNATLLGATTLPALTCNQPAYFAFATNPVATTDAAGRHLRLYLEKETPGVGTGWSFSDVIGWAQPFDAPTGPTVVSADGAADKVRVWEFHHRVFGHYFVTQSRAEAMAILDGVVAGWEPTGEEFGAMSLGAAQSPLPYVPVCRFFTAKFAPKSSHFYSPAAAECSFLEASNADWQLEDRQAFAVVPNDGESCPATTVPLYRLYNSGMSGAPNHRYTTSLDVHATMRARGWIAEGVGPLGVIGCVPGYDEL